MMRRLLSRLGALIGVAPARTADMTDAIITRHDGMAFAAQPGEADLDAWAADGVGLVINSRTPEETADLPFDLRAAVESRGMIYAELPIGGPYGAPPRLTEELARLLEEYDRPAVMHCRSGHRSAHLYAAYLARRGLDPQAAMAAIGWPGPVETRLILALTPPQ